MIDESILQAPNVQIDQLLSQDLEKKLFFLLVQLWIVIKQTNKITNE